MAPEKLDRLAAYFGILILCLFALGGSEVFHSYRIDVQTNYDHCHAQKDAADNSESKDCQGLIYKTLDDPVALFTFGLFVFTMALAIFTFRLVKITKAGIAEQAYLTRTSLEHVARSADATVIASAASGRSAEIAERALVQLERPYVVVINPQLERQQDFGDPEYFVSYTVINIGKIPALLQSVRISVNYGHQGEPLDAPEIEENHRLSINPYIASGEKIDRLAEVISSDLWDLEDEIDQGDFIHIFTDVDEDV